MSPPIPVLLVACQLPPLLGPATRRPASWVREWPASGIEPVVLTAPPEDAARAHGYAVGPGSRPSFTYVGAPPPRGLAGWLRRMHAPPRLAWSLCHRAVREPETPWGRPAIARGLELARARAVRAVVSTSQPVEAHVVGRAIARAAGVPWIADFRDPMTEAEGRRWPTPIHAWLERREERGFFRDAALVWATCESAAARWRTRFPFARDRIRVRRNGVGPIDFASLPPAPAAPPLRIGHVGRFTDTPRRSRLSWLESRAGGPGGTGSTPAPLFAALAVFLARRPEAAGRVEWVSVGGDGGAPPPAGVIARPHPAVPYEEALALASTCHALYLPLTAPNRFGNQFVQQKVYDYAALRRPVLATGAPCEGVELLGSLAHLVAPGDAEALSRRIERLYDAGGRTDPTSSPPAVSNQREVAAACARDLLELIAARGARDTRREVGHRAPRA